MALHIMPEVSLDLGHHNFIKLWELWGNSTYHWRRNGPGVGRGARPPNLEKRGASTLFAPPPLFMVQPLSALPSVYQFISCHTLGSTALALVCVRGHFRVLENEKFSTPCEGETPPTPSPTRSLRSLVCVAPPHF